ncbi:hypothetical protein BGX28_000964 [Mortierella sp. GBA30]|nr:hypothetical protein BGX28_000964 [Mortierella sp. GBA30]
MRPNSISVLPLNTGPQFKDKPLPGSGASGGPRSVFGRVNLRRAILFTGGLLFVYIVLTTALGPGSGLERSGYPVVKHKERDHYEHIPQPIANFPYEDRQPVEGNVPKDQPKPAPPLQLQPLDEPWHEDPLNKQQRDSTLEADQDSNAGSGSVEQPAMVDDDGNVIPGTEVAEGGEENEDDKTVLMAHMARKASRVSYAQMLSSTRRERDYAIALIVREANLALRITEVYSVTNKNQTAPSNDIHDYLSLSKYYWPNKNQPNGLPYRRIDGHVNPEIETVRDYRLLRTMIREVHMMGMAYHFTGRKEYAEKSAMRLKEWFLDEATYMNPNINYGSLRKGERLGARTGVLDMFTIFRVFDALHYLKQEPTWPKDLIPRLQEWFTRYVKWLETSTLAKVERQGNNNHGTYFDVQIIGIYIFLGRIDDAREIARQARHVRIDTQVTAKGEQPEELERKTSWYYSVFNLQALMTLARWGDDLGVDMWFYEGPQGQSIKKALDFMLPFALSGGEGWPVENLKGFDMTDYLKCLQIAWHIYGDEKYLEAIELLEPKVQRDMEEGNIKTISTFMCDISTLLEATTRGGQGFIWHWCLT